MTSRSCWPTKPRDEGWELIGGRFVGMVVGARWEHNYPVQNTAGGLRDRLRSAGSPCRALTEWFRLRSRASTPRCCPTSSSIVRPCPRASSLDRPTVLVEVMSDGSVGRDRVEKWRVYQDLPSLQHHVLVERDDPVIEVFDRVGEAWFGQRAIEGLDASLDLAALHLSIPLAEIYRDVLKP